MSRTSEHLIPFSSGPYSRGHVKITVDTEDGGVVIEGSRNVSVIFEAKPRKTGGEPEIFITSPCDEKDGNADIFAVHTWIHNDNVEVAVQRNDVNKWFGLMCCPRIVLSIFRRGGTILRPIRNFVVIAFKGGPLDKPDELYELASVPTGTKEERVSL